MDAEMVTLQDMRRGLIHALRPRAATGYEIIEDLVGSGPRRVGERSGGPWIRERIVPGEERITIHTPVLKLRKNEQDIHIRFTNMSTNADMIAFANRFGLLGLGDHEGREWQSIDCHPVPCESLPTWRRESARMAALRALWLLIEDRGGEGQRLHDFIDWAPDHSSVSFGCGWILTGRKNRRLAAVHGQELWATNERDIMENMSGQNLFVFARQLAEKGGRNSELLDQWSSLNPREAALYFLHTELNERVRGQLYPQITADGKFNLHAPTLLGLMYTLLLMDVARWNHLEKRCAVCGGPNTRNSDFCSERCQGKDWDRRNRSKAARERRATGQPGM